MNVLTRSIPTAAVTMSIVLWTLLAPPRSIAAVYVSGRVLSNSGKAVDGAAVVLRLGSTQVAASQTLINGSFLLRAPEPGAYTLVISKQGFRESSLPLAVSGAMQPARIVLKESPPLRCRVLRPSGEPYAGGRIQFGLVLGWSGGTSGYGTQQFLDMDGKFEQEQPKELKEPPNGVILVARNAHVGCASLHLTAWPDAPVSLKLAAGSSVVGRVTHLNGSPAAGIQVVAVGVPGDMPMMIMGGILVTSDGQGHYRLPALWARSYTIRANAAGAEQRTVRVSAAETRMDLHIP